MSIIDYQSSEGDDYHRERHKEIFGNEGLIAAWGAFAAATYFPRLQAGMRVLEIGAGTGINISHAVKVADVVAVEPSAYARSHCQQIGVSTTFERIEDVPKGRAFDYILLRHVLEHVPNPGLFIEGVKPLLKEEGEFVVVLPVENASAPINPDDIDFHLFSWNRQTIRNLLVSRGFRVTGDRLAAHNGRRISLPLFKLFGIGPYSAALRILGKLTGAKEIIMRCTYGGEESTESAGGT